MDFMQPELYRGEFYKLETSNGIWFVPADVCRWPFEGKTSVENPLVAETETDDEDLFPQEKQEAEDQIIVHWFESVLDYTESHDVEDLYSAELITGYGARLSAPGYMDCTEWCVFETEEEAKEHLDETYGDNNDSE